MTMDPILDQARTFTRGAGAPAPRVNVRAWSRIGSMVIVGLPSDVTVRHLPFLSAYGNRAGGGWTFRSNPARTKGHRRFRGEFPIPVQFSDPFHLPGRNAFGRRRYAPGGGMDR